MVLAHDLHGLNPSGITRDGLVVRDLFDLKAVARHQLQGRFEQFDAANHDRIRLTRPIFLQSRIEDGALGCGKHEIAFLNADRQIIRGIFAGHRRRLTDLE